MLRFILNDTEVNTSLPPGTVVLDYIRYHQHLKGTKIGCREGDCGACTILIGELHGEKLRYRSATSCLTALGSIRNKHVVTVEGINLPEKLTKIQSAMCDNSATQCGFCTPGFVVSMTGFCLRPGSHDYASAVTSVDGNICRCTGYKSIRRALAGVSDLMQSKVPEEDHVDFLIREEIIPSYFGQIPSRLQELQAPVLTNAVQAKILGGGTDLYVQQHELMIESEIRFLQEITVPEKIKSENGKIIMDASATITDLLDSALIWKAIPGITNFLSLVSSTPIRNIATIAGNFVNASPIGDLTILFLALDASIHLTDGESMREVRLIDFYHAYKTLEKRPEEFIASISFVPLKENEHLNFEKISKRTNLDIASVNTALTLRIEDGIITRAKLSAGGVAPVPKMLKASSQFLEGRQVDEVDIHELAEMMMQEISPISDVRGTAEYKRLLLRQLVHAHFITLFPEIFK